MQSFHITILVFTHVLFKLLNTRIVLSSNLTSQTRGLFRKYMNIFRMKWIHLLCSPPLCLFIRVSLSFVYAAASVVMETANRPVIGWTFVWRVADVTISTCCHIDKTNLKARQLALFLDPSNTHSNEKKFFLSCIIYLYIYM